MLVSVDDVCRSLALPSEAKIVDRGVRVALHTSLLGNWLVRGDRAALHASLLRTWKALLTRCCCHVVFHPPVVVHTTIARPCQTSSLILMETFVWHFRFYRSAQSFPVSIFDPCFAQLCCQHVFGCAPQFGSSRCADPELGDDVRTLRAR